MVAQITYSYYTCFFFNDTATTEIYTRKDTLSLHDALPISLPMPISISTGWSLPNRSRKVRSEEHTSELQSPFLISYAVFCLKKKKQHKGRDRTSHVTLRPLDGNRRRGC